METVTMIVILISGGVFLFFGGVVAGMWLNAGAEILDSLETPATRDTSACDAPKPCPVLGCDRFAAGLPDAVVTTTHGANAPGMTYTSAPLRPGDPVSIPSCWPAPEAALTPVTREELAEALRGALDRVRLIEEREPWDGWVSVLARFDAEEGGPRG